MVGIKYESTDEYIRSFPEAIQMKLEEIRGVIKERAPQASEKISYSIPTFYLNGNLVHFAGYANHIGFYPGAAGISNFTEELSKYKSAKGSVQFPMDEPLPVELIQRIVDFRVAENMLKKKK
ncbi:iron chaperone [Paenibacillus sp. sgz500958]|uniref:iron chaperone n=1 Tax=Paenibacillus sp. sgz500958 TaxID=3242475 RepID=UPI0036D3FDEA